LFKSFNSYKRGIGLILKLSRIVLICFLLISFAKPIHCVRTSTEQKKLSLHKSQAAFDGMIAIGWLALVIQNVATFLSSQPLRQAISQGLKASAPTGYFALFIGCMINSLQAVCAH
jgi:hypothetical protein